MNKGTTYIIGAGLAGLSAATKLAEAGIHVMVCESGTQAGGRCRSYHDSTLGEVIDNGNHLLLSGNDAALGYLRRIGAKNAFISPEKPVFDFTDAATAKHWTLHLSRGRIPFWLFHAHRRVPGTRIADYFSVLRLLRATPGETAAALLGADTPLYRKLWHPLLLSALNTAPEEASAILAGSIVRGTLLQGGEACIPLVAKGLSDAFIDPALRYITAHGGEVRLGRRLQSVRFENTQATGLEFSTGDSIALSASDSLVCAVPGWSVAGLLPGTQAPDDYRAILNAHFSISPPPGFPCIMGVLNATTEWIFTFPRRISVTVSDAGRLMQEEREALAQRLWQEVSAIAGLAGPLPPWQIVKEKRATFAATPAQDAKRPGTRTPWRNVFLAGDYVQTGLPATIEGAVRSGAAAADMIVKRS